MAQIPAYRRRYGRGAAANWHPIGSQPAIFDGNYVISSFTQGKLEVTRLGRFGDLALGCVRWSCPEEAPLKRPSARPFERGSSMLLGYRTAGETINLEPKALEEVVSNGSFCRE